METTTTPSQGILSEDRREEREELIGMLEKAYWMELETVMSYLANSINPDGVRAQEIKESLEEDVQEELGHARQFGARIKELYGVLPGSLDENLNCAEVRFVGDFGPLVMEATGGTVSIVQVQVADPVLPNPSTVVMVSVCWPLVRPL